MRHSPRRVLRTWAWAAETAALLLAACPAVAAIDAQQIDKHVTALTATPHRLAGSPEGRQAGDYILGELKAMGFGDRDVMVQTFPVVQMARAAEECYIEVDGKRVAVEPIRPNGLALPATSAEGIEGPTVYLGPARPEDFAGKNLTGKIAVMDFAGGLAWMDAMRLGAKAVVFVGPALEQGPDPAPDNSTQWLSSHFPAVRVYVSREQAEQSGLLQGSRARLFVRMQYLDLEGRNIVVTIPGAEQAQPQESADGLTPVVAAACQYDTFGPIPFLSPSPRKAANVAGVLELARQLRQSPPPMTTALIFFDNNSQWDAGQIHFHFARLKGANDAVKQAARMIQDRQKEAEYLRLGIESLARPDELIQAAAGSHLTWRNWMPPLVLGLSAVAFVVLLILLVTDAVRWHGGTQPGPGAVVRLAGLLVAIAAFTLVEAGIIQFSTIGLGENAAAKTSGSYELGALVKYMAKSYDDQREELTNLRLDLLNLSSEVRDAVKSLRTHMQAIKADQQDTAAAKRADAAVEAMLEAALGRATGATSSLTSRAGEIGQRLKAAQEALAPWQKSLEGRRLRNERFITLAVENLVQSTERLIKRGPALERQIDDADRSRTLLGEVRLGIRDGNIPREKGDPNELSGSQREEARHAQQIRVRFEQIMAQRRQSYQARLDEIDVECRHLEASRQIGLAWSARSLKTLLYLDLTPADAPWAPTVPPSDDDNDYNYDPRLLNWVTEWTRQSAGTMPRLGSVPEVMLPQAEKYWRVSGSATLVVSINNPGAVWPNVGHPTEPKADARAYASTLNEVEGFLRDFERAEFVSTLKPVFKNNAINLPRWDDARRRYDGSYVRRYGGGSVEAEIPVPGAVVVMGRSTSPTGATWRYQEPDLWTYYPTRSSQTGTFRTLVDTRRDLYMTAVLVDDRGRISHISQFQPTSGSSGEASNQNWNQVGRFKADRDNNLCMFEACPVPVLGLRAMTPKDFKQLHQFNGPRLVMMLRGEDNVTFPQLNISGDHGAGAIYVGKLRRFKLLSYVPLLLNNSPEEEAGMGYPQPPGVIDGLGQGARDLWELNQGRLGRLEKYGIFEKWLSHLHEQAERQLGKAELLEEQFDGPRAEAHLLAALQFSNLIYEPTRITTDDLIQAVVILLLLAIPFSFAVERVVVGTPNVYRQIIGFAVVFLSVFTILYFAHPAFRFATFPMLVLLAFVIIILSGLVIAIMKARFEYEVRKLQGVATASHRSTRNARQTISAAVTQGIASMRRRPVRTLLTALTIILLTFTIMFFGSFSKTGGIRPVFVGMDDGPARVEIALSGGRMLDGQTTQMLRRLWMDRSTSFVRSWEVYATSNRWGLQMPILAPGGKVAGAQASALIAPEDINLSRSLREALGGELEAFKAKGGILLPKPVFDKFQLPADGSITIGFCGRPWVLRGWFQPRRLESARMADGASYAVPDVNAEIRNIKSRNPAAAAIEDDILNRVQLRQVDPAAFARVDPSETVLVWDPNRRDSQGAKGIVLIANNDQDARLIGEEAATLLDEPVIRVAGGRADRVFYTTQLSVTGFRRLIVPLILGGLIIFSTMLASVSDRRREVFTLSALGLAPVHVAILFFAEAAVYSVIGGMAGYLLSQAFGKVVEMMARAGWLVAPAMNYSSMNAMFSVLLVMATVLASTVYPAFKAARSANPGIQRRWRMPKASGDVYDIRFPFTVSAYDMVGLISFLEEFLLSHSDRSVGSFAADQVRVDHTDGRFVLSAMVWLQPFDQGVCQTFQLQTVPSDIEGIDEIRICMNRLAGSPAIWQRSTNTFIEEVRQQFIFWRTIDEDSIDHYHQRTLERFALTEVAQ